MTSGLSILYGKIQNFRLQMKGMSLLSGEVKKGNTAGRVFELAKPLCDELGLFLWDVRFEKEGATWYLRVLIDKDGGVDMDDCEEFSRRFNKILDDVDPISQSYVFEVGSPGLGRQLNRPEHFEVCIGDEVRIRFIRPVDGMKEVKGILTGYEKPKVTIRLEDGTEKEYGLSDAAYVKLCDDEDLF